MRIVTVASDTVWKDVDENLALTRRHTKEVKNRYPDVQLIVFPELSLTGFVLDDSVGDLAQSLDGPAIQTLGEIAKEQGVALMCGLIETNSEGKPYNTAVVFSRQGELVASYRKNHLFSQSAEPDLYEPGETLTVFELEGWRCGLSICFDNRYPRLYETYKSAGVELVFCPMNWVKGRNKPEIMDVIIKARAHENQYFVVGVDRSGSDPNTIYHAKSVITNPYAEDIGERDDIYTYAVLKKEEIKAINDMLPLSSSFKKTYTVSSD